MLPGYNQLSLSSANREQALTATRFTSAWRNVVRRWRRLDALRRFGVLRARALRAAGGGRGT